MVNAFSPETSYGEHAKLGKPGDHLQSSNALGGLAGSGY